MHLNIISVPLFALTEERLSEKGPKIFSWFKPAVEDAYKMVAHCIVVTFFFDELNRDKNQMSFCYARPV